MALFDFLSDEEWRDIKGFEGYYQVSDKGRVKGLNRTTANGRYVRGNIVKPTGSRYQSVSLWKDNIETNKLVHRLVAEAFIPNPDNLPEVNHKDRDFTNNCVSNLEWTTSAANHSHYVSNRGASYSYRRAVKCLETGEVFKSISAGGRSVCADATQVIESITSKSCCKGVTFVYADDLPLDEEAYMKAAHAKYQDFHFRPNMPNSKRVRVIETGKEFDSIAAAANFFECDTATIRGRIIESRTVNGFTLEFIDKE